MVIRITRRSVLAVFVDLDGTLTQSHVNNTYTFINLLIHSRATHLRRKIYKIVFRLSLAIISLYNLLKMGLLSISLDSIFITMFLFGFDIYEIKRFSSHWLKVLASKKLINEKVLEYIRHLRNMGAKIYLITACIEYPACLIVKTFSIDKRFGRGFIAIGRYVVAVNPLSPHPLKARFLNQEHLSGNRRKIYILDLRSAIAEKKFLGIFDEIIIVGLDGSILKSIKPNKTSR